MASDTSSPSPQIIFSDYLTDPKQRDLVEHSVAAHVAHAADAAARTRAAEAERGRLVATLQAPLIKQIKGDPEATKALDELSTAPLLELDATNVLRRNEQPLTATFADLPGPPFAREVTT